MLVVDANADLAGADWVDLRESDGRESSRASTARRAFESPDSKTLTTI
jgi:hypothetical protein